MTLQRKSIENEKYREYVFKDGSVYRIDSPKDLYTRIGGTTHRVVAKSGVTHCVQAPGQGECIALRWVSDPPVNF